MAWAIERTGGSRRRVAPAPMTRRLQAKPSARSLRQSSAPLRQPSVLAVSSAIGHGARLLERLRIGRPSARYMTVEAISTVTDTATVRLSVVPA
jgi:hypothetical protein